MSSPLTLALLTLVAGAVEDGTVERTWAGWLVGLVPAIAVVGVAYLIVRRIRRGRDPDED